MSRFDDAEFSSNPSVDVSEEMENLMKRGDRLLQSDGDRALAVLREIMDDKSASTEHRLQAATYISNVAMQREHMDEYRRHQERPHGQTSGDTP